ncbi:MAG: hypothetical protein ACYS8W_10710 [Planctomycetota bacterium]|jgi:hypothetical protein
MNLYRGSTTMRLLSPLGRGLAFLYAKLRLGWKKYRDYCKSVREEEAKIPCDENHVTLKKHRRFINIVFYDALLVYSIIFISVFPINFDFSPKGMMLFIFAMQIHVLAIIAAPVLAYPAHRIVRAAYSKPEDKTVPLTWLSRAGRYLTTWKGLSFSFLLVFILAGIQLMKLSIWHGTVFDPSGIYVRVVLGQP